MTLAEAILDVLWERCGPRERPSLSAFCRKSGLKRGTLYRSPKRGYEYATVTAVAEALNVPVADLAAKVEVIR